MFSGLYYAKIKNLKEIEMSKLSKAIKITEQLSDDEKKAFAQYFTEEQEDEQEEKEEVEQKEVKEEKKETKIEQTDIEKLFIKMNEKIESLEEKLIKNTPFGAKQKQQGGKESTEFDDLFASLRSQQRG